MGLIIGQTWLLIMTVFIGIFTWGQFWPSGIVVAGVCVCVCVHVRLCVCVCQPRACPHHNSSRVKARTTKFGQKMQNNMVKICIVLGGDWPWPSKSSLAWITKFILFWHNSPPIQARTTKFGAVDANQLANGPYCFGGDWQWSSWSNLTG